MKSVFLVRWQIWILRVSPKVINAIFLKVFVIKYEKKNIYSCKIFFITKTIILFFIGKTLFIQLGLNLVPFLEKLIII